ncbi:MAG: TMEM175 family protein [Methanobrevibacter sp.]
MVHNKFLNKLKDRHTAITDGVFAIAMTILVLEIAVPTTADITSGVLLKEYLINYLAPSILIYVISFYLVYNFWENTVILFNIKKVNYSILTLNMITMATVCLIPFATGFLFKFYNYTIVNILFSLLILIISLLYILIFILLIRHNFKDYYDKREEIKTAVHESYEDGIEFPTLKLYFKGITLTLFYLLLAPAITSLISLALAFVSPFASILSFLLILILVFIIRIRRFGQDKLEDANLSDDEKEFIADIQESIYGKE